jgi:transposase InsO family protein
VTDITYIRTHEGWSYLAVAIDLFSRRVVGWSMQSRMTTDLALQALLAAVWRRKPKQEVMIHSDQGSQFTGGEWQSFLGKHNLVASMSRRGNCHDNAVAESFFQLLKRERIRRQTYTKGLFDPELMPFMPLLLEIVDEAPSCPTIACMYLHILECSEPSTAEIPLAAAADQWDKAANNRFWNELGIGRRVLSIGQKAARLSDVSAWKAVSEALVGAGVPVDADFLRRVHG